MRDIIKIKNLNFSYNKIKVFDNFNLEIKEGTFISLIGTNKCGKSTLIKLISGILPSRNSIVLSYSYIDNKRIQDSAKNIGVYISDMDNPFLFDDVYNELAFPLENLKYQVSETEKRISEISKLLKIEKLLDKKTYNLSSAERQKVLLALAMIHKPKVLLLDNPWTMMNKNDRKFYLSILKDLVKKEKLTVLLASSSLDDAVLADYVYILDKGNIVIEGTPLSVMQEDMLLNRLGLELPFMVDLSLKLKFYDLIEDTYIDMEELVNDLWK